MNGIDITKFLRYLIAFYYIDTGNKQIYRTWIQKVLWFTHWKFYRMHQFPFFSENFQSYKYGPVSWAVLKTQFFGSNKFQELSYDFDEIMQFYKENRIDEFKKIIKTDFLNDFNEDYYDFDQTEKENDLILKWECFVFVFQRLKKMRPHELINLTHTQKSFKIAVANPNSKVILNETILDDDEIQILAS
ncbi:Panacea domain-containing protein [Mycoplasma sp. 'Moose RK']|uniref:Panacea domain-containing protein n=1 Tax=Mycoplasma sp. 'Moose RK' TaxID=2780095 RepID=UPI0018C2C56B|nr:Panacea domain-containing protein [Mycoplasma sp. 'Moose RK']MBG0730513.1 SocA family protein [Mycoplasma sp. 'Moose RK']